LFVEDNYEKILNLISEYLIPDHLIDAGYYDDLEESQIEVFLGLISYIIGDMKYFAEKFPELKDPEECIERFLPFLAKEYGYSIPEGTNPTDVRWLIKHYLDIRRKRGTYQSILNAARFAGREELAYLQLEEGIDIRVEEVEGAGLVYVDGANINIEEVEHALKDALPAGVKFTYAIQHNIPGWSIKRILQDIGFKAIFDPRSDNLILSVVEESNLFSDIPILLDDIDIYIDEEDEVEAETVSSDSYSFSDYREGVFTSRRYNQSSYPDKIRHTGQFDEKSNLVKM